MRRVLRISLWCAAVALAVLAAALLTVYRGSQHVPEFYREALAPPASRGQQRAAGDEFERDVLTLRNAAVQTGRWQAEFTDERINAWLAAVLPQNHPRALPAEIRDPRVKLSAEAAQIGCRFRYQGIDTVLSLRADVYLTDQPNQLAVRLRAVRAGWLPVPLSPLLERVSDAARRGDIDLTWSQRDGDPVALVRVPRQSAHYGNRELHLDGLGLDNGKIRLFGHTERRGGR